jgi:hypothetical protein
MIDISGVSINGSFHSGQQGHRRLDASAKEDMPRNGYPGYNT